MRILELPCVLAALILSGCGTVALRRAMNDVQERNKRLTEALETGAILAASEAALSLRKALEAPEVSMLSPRADDPEFQRLLREAVESTEKVRAVARKFDAGALSELRFEVSATCDACHERFGGNE